MPKLISAALAVALLAVVMVSPGLGEEAAPVYLTVDPMAMVELGDDIIMEEGEGSWLHGETDLTVGANFPYSIDAHWLAGSFFAWFDTEFDLDDFESPSSTGSQAGELRIAVNFDLDEVLDAPVTDDESGAVAWDEARVMYHGETFMGTVQVTLTAE